MPAATAAPDEPAGNLVANLRDALSPAGGIEGPAVAPVPPPVASAPPEAAAIDDLERLVPGERRNPRSRRLPINRGRHLSRTFFEEGDKQEQTGWENSPLVEEPFGTSSSKLGFSSFDRVPRKRGPVIAAAAGIGMVVAILGAWALGGSSSPRDAKPGTDVWSALRVPGAGWQPQGPTTTTTPRPAPKAAATHAVAAPTLVTPTAPTPAPIPTAARAAVTTPAVSPPAAAPAPAAKPAPAPKAPSPVAFAPTRDVAKAPVPSRPSPVRVATPPTNNGARRHAVAARRVQPRPAARTAVPARSRVKSPPAPAVTATSAVEAAEAPAAQDPAALPAASAPPEPAVTREAPAAEPESAPGDVP